MAAESRQHTLFKSPAVYIGDFCCRPHDAGCSREEDSVGDDIAFVRRGLFIKHTGRRQAVANPNHVVFFNRNEPYRVSHPVAGGDDCTVIALRRDMLMSVVKEFSSAAADRTGPMFAMAETPISPQLQLRHLETWRAIHNGTLTDLAAEEAALNLAAGAIGALRLATRDSKSSQRASTRRAHQDTVEHAKFELGRRFRDSVRLDDLALQVNASPFHLCRIFRRHTGQSIHEYRLQLRLRDALHQLAGGRGDLTRLALELGFADHSHFANAFRRAFGVSPSTIRTGRMSGRFSQMSRILQA